jgi:hypothetical protein
MKYFKLFEQHINEATYGQNFLYEIATPAPTSSLAKELEGLFGKGRVILGDWKSPEGLEAVTMLNLTPSEIAKIKSEFEGEVLIFKMEITNRKEI